MTRMNIRWDWRGVGPTGLTEVNLSLAGGQSAW